MNNWKAIISNVAPTLATAIGGPMVGAAVKFLGAQFLGDENASEDDVAAFVAGAGPDQLLAIKSADHDFKVQMERVGIDVFQIEADDKKNSRAEHKHSTMPAALSISLTLLVGLIVFMLFYVEVPSGAKEVLYMLLGVVVKEWGGSMQFWFGTTRSSAEKTRALSR